MKHFLLTAEKKIIFSLLFVAITIVGYTQTFNPVAAPSKGFNVLVRGPLTFTDGHTDGPVALGGDLTLAGFNIVAMASYGEYPFGSGNTNNYGLVIGGKINFNSGNVTDVSKGYLRLRDTSNARVFTQDCNNASGNTRITAYNASCNTAYNSTPRIQMAVQQTRATIVQSNGLNFDSLAFAFFAHSTRLSGLSTCGGNVNVIAPVSGSANISLVNNKTNVMNLTSAQLGAISSLTFNNQPTASMPMVFNINLTGNYTWTPFNTPGIGGAQAPYIIYNFYNCSGTITINNGNTIEGTVLAPNAFLQKSTAQNLEGQVFATGFGNNGGEVHHFPFASNQVPRCQVLSLGNLVWNDLNSNGVKDANEPGISGATVKLYADANGDNVPDGAAILTTTTGSDGSYYLYTLTAGKYIVGVTIPSGYAVTTTTTNSSNPDSNTDNDNNGVTTVSGEVRSNFITLSYGGEPSADPEDGGNNRNNTLDFGFKGTGSIGNYVWNDLNKNGVQDANEPGLQGVTVTLTFRNGTVISTTTDANGAYSFTGLGPDTYTVTFTTPAGMTPTLSNQGSNDNVDSDPVNGIVTVTLAGGATDNSVDAGFYRTPCTNTGSCSTGFVRKTGTNVTNGNFATAITSPLNNTFGSNNSTVGVTYNYAGGSFISQAEYKGVATSSSTQPNTDKSFVLVNMATNYSSGSVNQAPFPGDPTNGVAASNTYLYHNGNSLGGAYVVWQQTLTGLVTGRSYTFRFYATNMIDQGNGAPAPAISLIIGGDSGLPFGGGSTIAISSTTLDWAATNNDKALSGWQRFSYTFTASATSLMFKIIDNTTPQNNNGPIGQGDDLGITGIGLDYCMKDTDGDCVADVDDLDDDNDGILDTVESGGYDPLGDCDNDGIANYLDQNPGCAGLTWADCNVDNINDFFDWDRDGIINSFDLDSDNDGILDIYETRDTRATDMNNDGMADGVDADGDGIMSTADSNDNSAGGTGLTPEDLDRDGTPNCRDLDSDGDGITDLTEALGTYDSDGIANATGTVDSDLDGVRGNYTNSTSVADNYDGFGAKGIRPIDTDSDGKPNPYDIDSDGDGITDNVEGMATCSYALPANADCDGDGVDNSYDVGTCTSPCTRTSGGNTPVDKDSDGTPDYLDTDSDGDTRLDIYEGNNVYNTPNYWTGSSGDADSDGLIDYFDGFNIKTASDAFWKNVANRNMSTGGGTNSPTSPGSNSALPQSAAGSCPSTDRDWRNLAILPVLLVDFKGNINNNVTRLVWTVTDEKEMSYYEAERSTDGINFTPFAKRTAVNGGSNTYSYLANDELATVYSNVVYYRIKLVEKDGKYRYSSIISFRLDTKGASIAIHPNPAVSSFTLKLNSAKDALATISITDVTGRNILAQHSKVFAGVNAVSFNTANMQAGTYNVQVIVDGAVYNQKLVIVR